MLSWKLWYTSNIVGLSINSLVASPLDRVLFCEAFVYMKCQSISFSGQTNLDIVKVHAIVLSRVMEIDEGCSWLPQDNRVACTSHRWPQIEIGVAEWDGQRVANRAMREMTIRMDRRKIELVRASYTLPGVSYNMIDRAKCQGETRKSNKMVVLEERGAASNDGGWYMLRQPLDP